MSTSGSRPMARRTSHRKHYFAAATGLAFLVAAALAVVFVLPATLSPPTTPDRSPETAEIVKPSASATTFPDGSGKTRPAAGNPENDRQRLAAENLLRDVLRKQAELESERVQSWGERKLTTSYPEVLEALAASNARFDTAAYEQAAGGFRQSLTLLDTLSQSKDDRYRLSMAEGTAALASENAENARAAFEIALALRPDDPQAGIGLARAQSLTEVLGLMEQGRRRDLNGDLDGAYAAFKSAADLDPAYRPARDEARRTGALIADRDYRRAVSDAIRNLDDGDFRAAAAAIAAARKIRPDTPEIRDIAVRLRQERRIATIRNLSSAAEQAIRREDWETAVAHYRKVLATDSSVADAVSGLSRAERMVRLHEQIAVYVNAPDRLSSDAPLDHARLVLRTATAIERPGPRLRAETARLRDMIEAAAETRLLVLKSDGETAVTIYRVARFGSFTEKRVELRPGKYTAVGSRPGYRDVRIEFRVPRSDTPLTLVVQCIERI
jgi:tetratricopeptide (TPR) repeat protein